VVGPTERSACGRCGQRWLGSFHPYALACAAGKGIERSQQAFDYDVRQPTDREMPLEAGMTFTDEPSILPPGRQGARIEDVIVVEEDGGRKLTRYPAELAAGG
jgi:hypothetical protein